MGVVTQAAAPGVAAQLGGVVPVSNATLLTLVVPVGSGLLTDTATLSTRVPWAGTARPVQLTWLPLKVPPLSALTNVTFGSSWSVTA